MSVIAPNWDIAAAYEPVASNARPRRIGPAGGNATPDSDAPASITPSARPRWALNQPKIAREYAIGDAPIVTRPMTAKTIQRCPSAGVQGERRHAAARNGKTGHDDVADAKSIEHTSEPRRRHPASSVNVPKAEETASSTRRSDRRAAAGRRRRWSAVQWRKTLRCRRRKQHASLRS